MKRTLAVLLAIAVTGIAASAAGQDAKYKAPRTEDGRPDLQGVWNFSSAVPLQRPAWAADRKFFTKEEAEKFRASLRNGLATASKLVPVEAIGIDWFDAEPLVEDLRTSLISYPADGRLPALVKGVTRLPDIDEFLPLLGDYKGGAPPPQFAALLAAFTGGKKDSYTDFNPTERCLFGANVPMMPGLDLNYVQFIQARDHIALAGDFVTRVVALDGTPFPADALRTWSGSSRGHWEGDTLVVETRNFNNRPRSFAGAGNAHDKVVVERFTRTAENRMEYVATIVDPKTFQDRIELSFPMTKVDGRIYEATCHEGNYSLRNSLSASRKEDAARK
jgi:hypothetical protein